MKASILCLNYSASHYSSRSKYEEALPVLFRNKPSYDFEVIFIDNGSTDDSVSYFRQTYENQLTVVPLPVNFGFQKGMNEGANISKGEYIILHNPDIAVTPGALDQMINYMDEHPEVALMGPRLKSGDGSIQDIYRKFMQPLDFLIKRIKFLHKFSYFKQRMTEHLMWNMDKDAIQEVDWIIGAFVIIRREAWEDIGGFDERYFVFLGDTDLCKQFWNKGWKVVYNPTILAYHGDQRCSGNGFINALFKRTAWIHLADMLKYFWKWRGKWKRTVSIDRSVLQTDAETA